MKNEMAKKIKIIIDPNKCVLSGECIKVCPQKAIYVKGKHAVVDDKKCDLDGICIPSCPKHAISFKE